ncbi:DUF2807 domain-containing protein [Pedobacter aquatilis]|uniref:GIN domain-containing protein n=1 Tax=Pedobacter aquatilis TaxID=351343 RepID=UPI0025B48D50|nr:DUF2807 domain-containing protein [Pedobacter aquatilis]MDN3587497.1 DUF2807 domain-containing protein [Pedobacter aquatilis]
MKTLLKLKTLVIIIILTTTIQKDSKAQHQSIGGNKIKDFNRIVVSGNVDVLLIPRPQVGILYDENNEGRVNVILEGKKLSISGTNSFLKAKLILYVDNVYRIEAKDNCVIMSDSRLNFKLLQVFVERNATVDLDINTQDLYTLVSDQSFLTIRGKSGTHTLITEGSPKLRFNDFIIQKPNPGFKAGATLLSSNNK